MSILVCGSMAYDTIMVFQDPFRKHILPDQIHILNVCFVVPTMRREFGGCAGNIAYNLRLLGEEPQIMATVGHDFGPYAHRLERLGLSCRHIRVLEEQFTAQAFITTDIEDNQITAFHPGAMGGSHLNRIADASGVRLGIVSPAGREGMIEHSRGFAAAGIPFILDPGQGMPMFSGEDLMGMLQGARALTVNDYEGRMFEQKTGRTLREVAGLVEAVVMTRGPEGATVFTGGQQFDVPPVKPEGLVDPTGCGDAHRAGLLHGLVQGWGWAKAARLGSLMGSIKIAHRGGQNHSPSREEVAARYEKAFGETL
ncbi:carbohydrate kinase family protein [Betaproteobacteria bacterium GR16-43]|nr:carbohydrate kinase family protein [Betaproteobacteria bacterium GR16-43]